MAPNKVGGLVGLSYKFASVFLSSPTKTSDTEPKSPRKEVHNVSVAPNSSTSITAIDDTGILRVWFLLLEGLTNAVVQCPRKYQPQTLEVLFDILRSVTTVPGPNFSIYAVTHLLLPMLQSWVKRGNRSRNYWESTAANFKHACGLATELVVQELRQYLSVQGITTKLSVNYLKNWELISWIIFSSVLSTVPSVYWFCWF